MSKNKFNPNDWLNNQPPEPNIVSCSVPSTIIEQDIETVVSCIESAAIDIAPSYADWRDLGFALADALGENGRGYYQRLSRF